jgi:hypothetical protein
VYERVLHVCSTVVVVLLVDYSDRLPINNGSVAAIYTFPIRPSIISD